MRLASAAILMWLSALHCAMAQDAPQPRTIHAEDRYPYDLWRESWGGAEVQARSWTVYSGTTMALSGDIERPGWRLRTTGGYGQYTYRKAAHGPDGPTVLKHRGHKTFSDLLLGYQFQWQNITLKTFAGFTTQQHLVDPRDQTNSVAGLSYGGKAALEAWISLSKRHWLAGNLSWASSFNTFKIGAKTGYALLDKFDVGIEARLEGNEAFDTGRVGGFATFRFGDFGVTAGAGVTGDHDANTTPYANLSLFVRY